MGATQSMRQYRNIEGDTVMHIGKTMKVAFAAAAAAAMVVPLAACGGGADSGKTKLTFLSWSNEQYMKPIIDKFEEKNPDITIDFNYSPPVGEYVQTLQTRIVGNQAPDLFFICTENKSNIIDNDNALDLTNEPAVKNLSEANKEYLTKDGKTYGISVSSWESGIVYNKDLLAKVGADSIPENWDDFLALLKKLKDAGITPYLEPVDDVPKIFQAFLGAKYDLAGDTEAEKAIFEGKSTFEKEWTPELEQWYRLWDEDLVTRDAVGIDGNAVKTQFLNGELATMTTGPWDFKDLKSSNLNFGIAPVPALDGGEVYGAGSPSPGLAIYSKISDKKLDAAKKFLNFYISEDSLQVQSDNGDAITATNFSSKVIPEYEDVYNNGLRKSKYYLSMNYWTKSPDVLQQEAKAQAQQVVQGAITPRQAAKNMDAKLASLS